MTDNYKKCEEIMIDFLKNKYWNNFTNSDIFYIQNKNKKIVSSFISNFYGDSFGIQYYNNADGLNYLSDIFTADDEEINTIKEFECDAVCIILSDEEDLSTEEIEYLNSKKLDIKKENNLLIYRFECGYGRRFASDKEEKNTALFLELLHDIIHNDYKMLIANFKAHNSALIDMVDKEAYNILFDELPLLETNVKNHASNSEAIQMLNEMKRIDGECYINIIYSPVTTIEDNIRPALIYFSYPKFDIHIMQYMICDKKDYYEEFWNILLSVFDDYGVPNEILVSNRNFFSFIYKTFKLLNIDVFLSSEGIDEQVVESMAHVFNTDFEIKDEKEKIISILKSVCTAINSLNGMNLNEDVEFDEEEIQDDDEKHYVS